MERRFWTDGWLSVLVDYGYVHTLLPLICILNIAGYIHYKTLRLQISCTNFPRTLYYMYTHTH